MMLLHGGNLSSFVKKTLHSQYSAMFFEFLTPLCIWEEKNTPPPLYIVRYQRHRSFYREGIGYKSATSRFGFNHRDLGEKENHQASATKDLFLHPMKQPQRSRGRSDWNYLR